MENMDGKAVTEALIANVLNTRFEDIEHGVVDNTKRRILDTIGCAIGGARAPGNAELIELVKSLGGKTEATILADGAKGPVHDVAMVNCVLCRSFDRGPLTLVIDGDGRPGTTYIDDKPIRRFAHHTTETTALTALAVGESKGINGKELITALVVGDDLAARLHIANDRTPPGQAPSPDLAPAPVTRGSTATFGATAITGRLLGLNSTQMRNAFGLVMIMGGMGGGGMFAPRPTAPARPARQTVTGAVPGANPGWLGVKDPFFIAQLARGGYEETVSTKLSNGIEARNGINAAQLARAGWPGVKDPFFGERGGYYPGLASCNRRERITEGLGKKYHVEQVFKPYPGGRPTNAPTEAALAIVSQHDINVDDIEEVVLHLSPQAAAVHYS
ncbi:MAG: MmgE/PrpD family protein, partial [Dehalococcoidales bacterium]